MTRTNRARPTPRRRAPLGEKLSREEQLKLVQKFLPELTSRQIEEEIEDVQWEPEIVQAILYFNNKQHTSKPLKTALRAYRGALERVRATRSRVLRVASFDTLLPLSECQDNADRHRVLSKRIKREVADDVVDKLIKREVAKVDKLLEAPRTIMPSPFDEEARIAVLTARRLLSITGRPTIVSKKSDWCNLSAILYGRPNKNLYHFVAEVARTIETSA
jgi:hypothetical protein